LIARKTALIVGSQLFSRFLGWIGLMILAKLWGGFAPNALGTVGFAISFIAIFNIIPDLGFNQAHVKRVSEGNDLGTCIGTFAAIKIALVCAMIFLLLTTVFIWKTFFNGGFSDATTESIFFVVIFYYIFLNLAQIFSFTFEGTREIAKRQFTKIFENFFKVPLEIFVALAGVSIGGLVTIKPAINFPESLTSIQIFISQHAIGSYAMTYVISSLSMFITGLFLIKRYQIKKPNWDLFKSYLIFAIPIMLMSTIGIISANVDKIMIGYFWSSTEVGYYFTVQQIIQVIPILSGAVGVVLFPTISKYHSSNNLKKLSQTTHLAERYVSMIMIPPMVAIIIFSVPLINIILTSAFLPATYILILLTITAVVSGLIMPYSSLLSGINKPSVVAKVSLLLSFSNITLNFFFIPKNGLLSSFCINGPNGAAIATIISMLIGFFGLRIAAKKIINIRLFQIHTPKHIFAGFIMGLVLLFCYRLTPDVYWFLLILYSLFGLGIYLLILYLLKEFNKKDLTFFLGMIHPKDMAIYVYSELKGKNKT
jgi:O-antigen/teichoic acid export membrane protein